MGALVAVILVVGSGCGDDDGSATTGTRPVTATTAAPATTATAPTATTSTAVPTSTSTRAATTSTAGFLPIEAMASGVVIEVEGTLAGIDWFVLRLPDGTDLQLIPEEGLLFDGVAPISHIRDHLVSGVPVHVTYVTAPDGPPVATSIGDAGGGTHSHDE